MDAFHPPSIAVFADVPNMGTLGNGEWLMVDGGALLAPLGTPCSPLLARTRRGSSIDRVNAWPPNRRLFHAEGAKGRIDFCRRWRQKQPILRELRDLLFKLFIPSTSSGRAAVLQQKAQRSFHPPSTIHHSSSLEPGRPRPALSLSSGVGAPRLQQRAEEERSTCSRAG